MSVYNPPTFEEYLSVFNPADWGAGSSSGLDIAYLDANYLRYPVAQGTETFVDANVVGTLTATDINATDLTATTAGVSGTLTSDNNILFSGTGTTLTSGINYKTETVSLGNFNVTNAHLLSQLRFVSGANFNVNLQSTINSLNVGKPIWFCNTSAYKMTVVTTVGVFRGRYGNEGINYVVESGGTIGLYNGGTNWIVFFKDSQSIDISVSTNFTNSLQYLLNSVVRLTPSANIALTLPQLTTSLTEVFNGIITFNNTTNFNCTLNISSGNFAGIYGTYSASYIIYPYTTITIQPQPITNTYNIISRDLPTITRAITYTGGTTALTYNDLDSIINLSGSASSTVNLPDPKSATNPYIRGRELRIYNNGSAVITLGATSGNFTGSYGSGASTISLQDNTWYCCTSNGTTWDINERSSNITFTQTITGNVDYSAIPAYTDATLRIASNGAYSVTIPNPATATSHTTTSRFVNTSIYTLTLTIGGGTFAGRYGNGTTTLLIAPNSFVEYYSTGVDYLVDNRTSAVVFNRYLASNSSILASTMTGYLDGTLTLNPPDATIDGSPTDLTGTASQTGNTLTIASITGYITAGSVITISGKSRSVVVAQISGTAGGVGNYIVSISQTQASAIAFSGKASGPSTAGSTGTATQINFQSQTTNLPTAPLTVSSGTVGAGTSIYFAGQNTYQTYLLSNIVGGGSGTYVISSAVSPAITVATTFWATKNTVIQLPNPSSTLNTRRITITNNSYVASSITTVGLTNVFGGQYGPQQSSALGELPATNASLYVLLPSRTVVLECDGTNWNAVAGTTINATKTFRTSASNTSTSDTNPLDVGFVYTWQSPDPALNALQYINNTTGAIINTGDAPLTLLVTLTANWGNPLGASNPALATRTIGISTGTNVFYFNPANQITSPIPQTISGVNFAYTTTTTVQSYSQVVVLNYNDSLRMRISKTNGTTTAETMLSGYITIQRLF
jgi:hypothetical protein